MAGPSHKDKSTTHLIQVDDHVLHFLHRGLDAQITDNGQQLTP